MNTKTALVTYDDYRHLPDDGKRYEIIEGELHMTPSPKTVHQRVSRKILVNIDIHVEKNELGEVFDAPMDVVLSMTDVVQPDLFFVMKERSHIIAENNTVAAPDLVVEVLSESTEAIDRNQKKALYERYGVKEYWIIDPEEKKIEQYVLRDSAFELSAELEASDKLTSEVIEGFVLPLSNVFAR